MDNRQEQIGDIIYQALKEVSVTPGIWDRAYIADIVSKALSDAGCILPVPDEERREKIAEYLIYENRWLGSWNGFKFSDIPTDWVGKIHAYQQADSILRLIQPTLPGLPTEQAFYNAMYNEGKPITDKQAMAQKLHFICLETLKKAGYEEMK